jgi:hypothetical protein
MIFGVQGYAVTAFSEEVADGNAAGDIGTLTLTAPTASAVGFAAAVGDIGTLTLTAPTASAVGFASTSGAIGTLVLVPPTGAGSGASAAVGSIGTLTLTAPTATASSAFTARRVLVDLLGIVVDGAPRDPNLPLSSATVMRLQRLDSILIRMRVLLSSGEPLDTATIASMKLTVSQSSQDGSPLLVKVGSILPPPITGQGLWVFMIDPNDFRPYPSGRYVFDVRAVDKDGQTFHVVDMSTLLLIASVGI